MSGCVILPISAVSTTPVRSLTYSWYSSDHSGCFTAYSKNLWSNDDGRNVKKIFNMWFKLVSHHFPFRLVRTSCRFLYLATGGFLRQIRCGSQNKCSYISYTISVRFFATTMMSAYQIKLDLVETKRAYRLPLWQSTHHTLLQQISGLKTISPTLSVTFKKSLMDIR